MAHYNPTEAFETLKTRVSDTVKEQFPIEGKKNTLSIKKVWVDDDRDINDIRSQQEAKLRGRTWAVPLRAELELKDNKTGKVMDRQAVTLAQIPKITDRYTYIVGGNEYQANNQFRLKSNVYTHVKANGELSSQWNLAKGHNFDMGFDPKSKKMSIKFVQKGSNIPLYPVLKTMGVDDDTIERAWGKEVLDANKKGKQDDALRKFHKSFKGSMPDTLEEAAATIEEEFGRTVMDPEATKVTLGAPHKTVDGKSLLAGSHKILKVARQEEQPDDRDSLEFKELLSAEDLIADRIAKKHRYDVSRKIKNNLDKVGKKVKDIIHPDIFGKPVKSFFTSSDLAEIPDQMNPMSYIAGNRRTTIRGEGGIAKAEQVTPGAKVINPSHLGFLDPIQTPECYDESTEVFTKEGWKYWKDVAETDFLACNIDGRMEFRQPGALHSSHYRGPMYGLTAGKIGYLVTPNHRMWVSTPWRPDVWRIAAAPEIHGKERRFDCGHQPFSPGELTEHFELPKVKGGNATKTLAPIKMEDWAEFMGWYLSEGCVEYNEKESRYLVRLSQSEAAHPEEYRQIQALLCRLPGSWCATADKRGFAVGVKQLASYLEQFGKAHEKFIPETLQWTSVGAREALLESLLLGDGRIDSNRSDGRSYSQRVYTTTSRQLALDVERLAIGLGYPVSISVYEDDREARYLATYEVRLLQHRHRTARPHHPNYPANYYIADYDGMVYCATVLGGLLYIRRGGRTGFWCGNSAKIGTTLQLGLGVEKRGKDIVTRAFNTKTGKKVKLTPSQVLRSVVAYPDQYSHEGGKLTPIGPRIKVTGTQGQTTVAKPSEVDYVLASPKGMFDLSSNLIPFLQSDQGNRTMVAAKQIEQAVSLKDREAPMVQVKTEGKATFEQLVGGFSSHLSPVGGKVAKVTDSNIIIKDDQGKRHEIQLYNDFPMNDDKSFLSSNPVVEKGQQVDAGQVLADTNFTKDGTLALGRNLRVAYMPYKGYNFEDGIVISDTAAKKLTSSHMFRESVKAEKDTTILDKKKLLAEMGPKIEKKVADKLDDDAVIKPGSHVVPGDILIGAMKREYVTPEQKQVGLFSKKAIKPVRPRPVMWEKDIEGTVSRVVKHGATTTVYVKADAPADVGDKIVGRHGNKGIITRVLPDGEMPQTEDGRPAEVLLNPTGVPTRINLGQVLETAAGKIAEKTGKPYIVNNFDPKNKDYTRNLMAELKKHGISDTEKMIDPQTGRTMDNVFIGNQYIYKLHHMADKKLSVRSRHAYDSNMTPQKGGTTGGQAMDAMGLYALLAHNARENIREMQTYKADKNDDFWTLLQAGETPPAPKVPFVFTKFESYLKAMGIDVHKEGNDLLLRPITDDKIRRMSNGALPRAGRMITGRNDMPEKGGLFDPVLTGTKNINELGDKWTHIELAEKMPNPVFEKPMKTLLGLSKRNYDEVIQSKQELGGEKGPKAIVKALRNFDMDAREKELSSKIKDLKGTKRSNANKQLKYIRSLKTAGLTPESAYTSKLIPVLPPIMRPVGILADGTPNFDDINKLYSRIANSNDQLKLFDPKIMPEEESYDLKSSLYDGLKAFALTGFGAGKQHLNGVAESIAGRVKPKLGYFQAKVIGKRQDLSMRGTIVPEPSMSLDEVGVPRKAAKELYKPFIVQNLVRNGLSPLQAQREVKENTTFADKALERVMLERPLLLKRDPVLHKFGVQAFRPKVVEGKAVKIHPLATSGYNADFDGDTMSAFVPVSQKAIDEAFKMMPSSNLFSPATANVMFKPGHESKLGLFKMTEVSKKAPKRFSSMAAAAKAVKDGTISMQDPVSIDLAALDKGILEKLGANTTTTIGRLLVYQAMPAGQRDRRILTDAKFTLDGKNQQELLTRVAKEEEKDFARVANRMKDLGNQFSTGLSISLNDFVSDKKSRDPILAAAAKEEDRIRKDSRLSEDRKADKVVDVYTRAGKLIDKKAKAKADANPTRLYDWIRSGARGSWDQYKQMTVTPLLVTETSGRTVPVPIDRSYSEGLDIGSYWTTMHGARMGTINKVEGTWRPGYMGKQIMQTTMDQLIVDEDCGTSKGIKFPSGSRDIMGRYTVGTINLGKRSGRDKGTIPDGTLVTPDVARRLRNNKVADVRVRSPLKCSHGKGMCAKCYGTNENGVLSPKGTNVGVIAAQALGEPATQLSMNAFHCNHAHSLVIVRAGTGGTPLAMTMQDFFNEVTGEIKHEGEEEYKEVSNWEVWSFPDRWAPVLYAKRHAPSRPMRLLSDGGLVTICQDNHPVGVWKNGVACVECGHHRLKKNGSRAFCPECKAAQDYQEREPTGELGFLSPAELDPKRYFLFRDLSLMHQFRPYNKELSDDPWLVGMYLAEGCVTFKRSHAAMKAKKPYALDFAQEDGAVKDKLVATLEGLRWNPRVYKKRVIVNSLELGTRFHELFSRYAHNKALPPDFINYSMGWLALCLSGLIDGDGTVEHHKDGPDSIGIDTTSFALAQQVAFMSMRLGIVASIVVTPVRKLTRHQGFKIRLRMTDHACEMLKHSLKASQIKKRSPFQEIDVASHRLLTLNREVQYTEGYVYDLTTDSGVLFVGGLLSHNTGGVAGAKGSNTIDHFTRLDQLLQLPKKLPGAATLATSSGKVQRVEKDPAGGWSVFVEGQRHYVPATRDLKVKRSQAVKKGDALSSGPKNPREMRELVGMNHVQSYLVNEIQGIYNNEAPLSRRNTETFVRAMTNLSEVKNPGSHEGLLPGDKAATSEIVAYNSKVSPDKQIKYDPLMQGVKHLPTEVREDWIARLQSRDLKKTLLDAAAEGWKSEVHSTHPIPGMAYGKDFGKGLEDQPWLY